jgi:transaldolase
VRGVQRGEALRMLTAADVRAACDVLRPVFEATDGVDGRVSIEVDPRLAHDPTAAIAGAPAVAARPPQPVHQVSATEAGLPASRDDQRLGVAAARQIRTRQANPFANEVAILVHPTVSGKRSTFASTS